MERRSSCRSYDMTTEVFQSNVLETNYTYFPTMLFDLATFFSQSVNFNIIDSYSSHYVNNKGTNVRTYSTYRYKGDPIADFDPAQPSYKVWETQYDVNLVNNSWIVVECTTTRHPELGLPNWQVKFQFSGNGYYMDDVSDPTGVKYPKNHHAYRSACARFAPWGGWDLATTTPDFNPTGVTPTPSDLTMANHEFGMFDNGNDEFFYLVCYEGSLLMFNQRSILSLGSGLNPRILGIGCFMGDVDPLIDDRMPTPRVYMGGTGARLLDLYDAYGWCAENSSLSGNGDYNLTTHTYNGMAFFDDTNTLCQENYKTFAYRKLCERPGIQRAHQHVTDELQLELFPYIPIPATTKGIWFSVPVLRKGPGVGHCPINQKRWISTANTYTVLIKWDGVSRLRCRNRIEFLKTYGP